MEFCKIIRSFVLLSFFLFHFAASVHDHKEITFNETHLAGMEFPNHPSFNSVTSSENTDCHLETTKNPTLKPSESSVKPPVKFSLKHRSENKGAQTGKKDSVVDSTSRDLTRIQTLQRRIFEKKNQNTVSRLSQKQHQQQQKEVISVAKPSAAPISDTDESNNQLVATLESGVSLGSGEYFMDVFIGTPPKHFSLILDTGSDLNWIQCTPCYDCFEQNGPHYNPLESKSFKNISCRDPRCHLVSSPDPPPPCKSSNQTCPYYYWYGDNSNTTGDFSLETFTVNLTTPTGEPEFKQVEDVMFGCGHWNRGLFHGAAGLLGLGRGPLSFSSQLRSIYGHTFSYCLVDRNSDLSVSSKLIFGEDPSLLSHPNLNFTTLVAGKENPVDTFYYVQIKGIMVGGEVLEIPAETWKLSQEGAGGTIIDSGTTLSYFADPAYQIIKEAFVKKIKDYPLVKDFPVLYPCYNVSGVEKIELPEFAIIFGDGAVWNFPVENYFIRLDPEEVVCLAILGTPRSALSILGNYQQQNFHILYDTKKSRLGFAPMKCADV
ncbi:Peptidase A1 [Macleaya cordata]|uniref:Peptidase A1 n=1 Tax=Macleaya cordata TaxID=56857 RepID=A0A200QNF2_MACCD|nr:Peptidase A1 [Macleaya cordata]